MDRRKAEMFRDLARGQFMALGPALSRRPLTVRIGPVETAGRGGGPSLIPPPETAPEDALDLIMQADEAEAAPPPPPPPAPPSTEEVLDSLDTVAAEEAPEPPARDGDRGAVDAGHAEALAAVVADPEAAFRAVPELYQDFLVECRGRGVNGRLVDMTLFRRRLTAARAGLPADWEGDPTWREVAAAAESLDEELQGVFLMLARAAVEGLPCPSDSDLARARGSRSPRRARGLLAHLEQRGVIACREDVYGLRRVTVPQLGRDTAPGDPNAEVA